MRRVDCPRCGVTVERVPWADGKHQPDHHLHVVSRAVGQMPQLAGGRARLPHQLGPGVPVGRDGGGVGPRSRGSHRYSRDRHRRDPLAARGASSSRSSTRSTRRASACCGSASTDVPRPCSGSSAGSDGSGPPRSLSSAATCGRRISKSSPRRPGMPSTSWTGFTSLST